ncbi:hypothetical protein BT93_D1248 [Corymbia citriodora subsp. variegata]|nr:hypothetical protein BT93_D1248 [Corymbia citriodora subsp. variegata]
MRARKLSEELSSLSDVWKEWELRGAVFFSLALQIALICLGHRRKYLPHAWITVVTWLAYLSADSVAIYALGMISSMIREIKAGESLSKMDPHTELSTFWAPFLLLHLGGPDTISAYAIEDNELWLRHLLTLVNQAGLTVYVLVMAWTHPTLSFLAILILLSGFYKYGERVWVLRAASRKYFKESLAESKPRWRDSDKIEEECEVKRAEGYNAVPHQVIDINNEDAIMIDVTTAEFSSKKLSFGKDLEDQEYKRVAGTLLSASRLVDTSQRLFADHLFSMDERNSRLSILRGKHCAGDFKVIEIELGLIYDMFYSKAKAVYTRWGFICRLVVLFSICVALVLLSFTDKQPYSKPDLFLTFLLLAAAIFIELYALAHILFSDQRHRWSNSMGQYNLMSIKENEFSRWKLPKILQIEEMAVKFLYQGHADVTDDIKNLVLSKIKEMEARDVQKPPFPMMDRGNHALSRHKLLDQLKWSIELDFDMSILAWHIATELCYYLIDGLDSIKEKSLMGLHLSRYMLYLLFVCPSMLPARMGSIRFRDIIKPPGWHFDLPKFARDRPASGHNRRWRKPDISEEPHIAEIRDMLRNEVNHIAAWSASKEDQVEYMLNNGCRVAVELERVPRGWKWSVISQVWVEMLIYAAHKCKARDHAQQMQRGSELITHVWFLMAHYGLTEHFQIPLGPVATAEIIVNPW